MTDQQIKDKIVDILLDMAFADSTYGLGNMSDYDWQLAQAKAVDELFNLVRNNPDEL